jgi:hypothetical protein
VKKLNFIFSRALEADSEEDYEELDDDFVAQANQFDDAEEDFYKPRKSRQNRVHFSGDEDDEEEEYDEDDEELHKVVVERDQSKDSEERQIFEARFERVRIFQIGGEKLTNRLRS